MSMTTFLTSKQTEGTAVPPLQNGDRLTRAEFERRYRHHPEIKKAELIEGVVYMPSPVYADHGKTHARILVWAGTYQAATPGVEIADNNSLRLDRNNEVQPDVCVWIKESFGGRVRETESGFLEGAPELIIEVAASSASYDLHDKLHVYQENGVQEYMVLQVYERETVWLRWLNGRYEPIPVDEQGILRSQIFPGLCFDPDLFWSGNQSRLLALLHEGLQSAEHAAFGQRLQQASQANGR